ncbi:MAG: exonuclease domain-containing protein [bacterium]
MIQIGESKPEAGSKSRGGMLADTRDMLRAYPEGLTAKRIARKLLHLANAPGPIANVLVSEILGDRPEFEFRENKWHLSPRDAVSLDAAEFVVVDVETTGGRPTNNRVIELAAFRVSAGRISESMTTLINPRQLIPFDITCLTGIRNEHVADAPFAEEVMPGFMNFLGDAVFVAHCARFDFGFLNAEAARCGLPPICNEVVCTVKLARRSFPGENSYGLDRMIERFSIEIDPKERHRGHGDAWAASKLLLLCLDRLREAGSGTLDELLTVVAMPPKRAAKILGF